jgi:hypothetical protein
VYCVIAAARRPRLSQVPCGPSGLGPVRLLDVERGLYIAVADAPLDKYGEAALGHALCDLEQVSRAALAHEAVVESFAAAAAVLPMKLFTIFASDDRAVAHVRARRRHIGTIVERVARHQEWGVRVVRDRPLWAARVKAASGVDYLTRKKAKRDAPDEALDALYARLAARTGLAKRRLPAQLGAPGARLMLDAAFLVPRARAASFQELASRESRRLARRGYRLSVSGPWPPYSFMRD